MPLFFETVGTVTASVPATAPPQQVIIFGEYPLAVIPVIVQPLDEQFRLDRESTAPCSVDQTVNLLQTLFTKAVIVGFGQESMRIRMKPDLGALAVCYISYLAFKIRSTTWAGSYFMFGHRGINLDPVREETV